MAVQAHHDFPHGLLLGKGGDNAGSACRSDAVNLTQSVSNFAQMPFVIDYLERSRPRRRSFSTRSQKSNKLRSVSTGDIHESSTNIHHGGDIAAECRRRFGTKH
jgi:hypothetical protein